MNIEEIKSQRVGEHYFKINHPSGLQIFVYPKENYHSTYAIFGTKYGSIDTVFKRSDEDEICKVPAGIAHFLEHKLFESEDGDAFSRYAKTGASANAYTSFDATCYLFSCTENIYESLEILLDFVQSPYFTEQTVHKEQGIIGQEIRMYDDDPQWRVMFNLLRALYHKHPVKIDIAGSTESIAKITPDYLYHCYHTFYNLNNMALCIAGNIDVDKVIKVADRILKTSEPVLVDRIFEDEPEEIVKERTEEKLAVASPLFQLGFKEKAGKERISVDKIANTEILLDIIASEASPLFRKLLDAQLINESSFSNEYFEGPGYASIIFAGESKNPDEVSEAIKQEILRLRKDGIDASSFERSKKAVYGRNLAALNSAENIAGSLISFKFTNRELFSYLDAVATTELIDVQNRLNEQLDINNSALSIISPIN